VILLYVVFALTVSTILTALVAGLIPERRWGDAFIAFFVLLVLCAGAADAWLVPVVAAGQRSSVLPVIFLIAFGAMLAASIILMTRSTRPLMQAAIHRENRLEAEAAAFDAVLWLAVLIFGIAVLKAAGM
jgi:hypothetical protein